MKISTIKILILFVLTFYNVLLKAQTDTLFWFVAPEVSQANINFDRPILLRLSTLNLQATVTIDIPANPSFTPLVVNISANSTTTVDLTTSIDLIENRPPNQILNKGLRIRANNTISAYYEIRSQQCNCNPEIFALKGNSALGTSFYTPFQNFLHNSDDYSPLPYSSFDIVATEDNTSVTITPTKNIVGRTANTPFTITLNKGQTYSATATSQLAAEHLMGSKIESNKPIAVTITDDLLQNTTCADIAGDQLIPVSRIGREYIITKGFLTIPDRIFVLAVEDNTTVTVNGTLVGTINKGQTSVSQITTTSAYVVASKPVYLLHLSGYGCEVGMAILPPIECTGSTQVGFTRSTNEEFRLLIMVENGGEGNFTLNGTTNIVTPGIFSNVQSTGGAWKFATLSLNTTQIQVGAASLLTNSSNRFHMGIINGGPGSGTRYGYFSDFGRFEFVRANSNKDVYCFGDSIDIRGLTSSPASNHTWKGPNGFTSTSLNFKIPNASAIHEGYYVLEMETSVCGSTIDSVFVSIATNIFNKPSVTSNAPVCAGKKLVMQITNKPATPHRTVWYNQSMDSIGTGDSMVFNPLTSSDGSQFSARYKAINGSTFCSGDTSIVNIALLPTPPNPILTPNGISFCQGESLILSFAPFPPPGTIFEWKGPLGLSSDTTGNWVINNLNFSNNGFYHLRYIGSNGCESAKDSVFIQALNFQQSPTTISNSPVCEGEKLLIQITNKPIGIHRTIWLNQDNDSIDRGDSLVITNYNASHGLTFYVVYKSITGSTFCTSDTSNILIDLLPTPEKPILVPNKTSFCNGENLVITFSPIPTPGTTFEWKGPLGLSSDTTDNWHIPNLNASNSGIYSLLLKGSNGCESRIDSVNITVLEYPDMNLITASSNSPICSGFPLFLQANSSETGLDFSWSGPLSYSSNQANNTINNTTTNMSGEYVLTIGNGNCILTDTLRLPVIINQTPVAAFSLSKPFADVGGAYNFINQSTFATTYSWDFGDLSPRSSVPNPIHIYNDENTYSVILIAFNIDSTCSDTSFASLQAFNSEEGVYTPTGFSPNKDGKNDIFRVVATGVQQEITLEIYNRWGELLFQTDDGRNIGWDGTYMGKDCPDGVYVYIVRYKLRNGKTNQTRGTLTVLR